MNTVTISQCVVYMLSFGAISLIVGVAIGIYVSKDSSWRDA